MHAGEFVTELLRKGRYTFDAGEAVRALGCSPGAARAALRRLRSKGGLAVPCQGFYVIVPPEYRRLGCLPAEQFIPDMMAHLGLPYYAALLSAAEYHGAAHQRPQVFQVMVEKNRSEIVCGKIRVAFIARKNAAVISCCKRQTPRGYLRVSTPEATAFDLAGYPGHGGGVGNVAGVLSELAEKINAEDLAGVAPASPLAWAQRLGYLLETVGASCADALARYVNASKPVPTPLVPARRVSGARLIQRWNLLLNADVEAES